MPIDEALVKSIAILFLIVDPIGNAPIFHAVTYSMSSERRKKIIVESVIAATIILLVFGLIGDVVLSYFGLRIADFRVAGGIILLLYGVAGVMGFTEAGRLEAEGDVETIAIVPLATPLLAGPGAIATVLYIKAVYGLYYALVSTTVVAALTLVILLAGGRLLHLLGKSGAVALARIFSFLLAAIAVAMIREGVEEYIASINAESSS
ncbi:MarC family protein [Pyrolobus fumarii]|nr:MarC family protein [Pyrolobus fumarii]